MCSYIAIVNSIVIGSAVLQKRFGFNEVEAGYWFTIPYIVSAVLSPIIGIFVEKFGHRMTVSIAGTTLMLVAHVIQLFILPMECSQDDPCYVSMIPLILLGVSYTTYAVVLYGSLPYLVEARTLGTAFGICTVFQNLGTVIAPPVLGYIQNNTKDINDGYTWVEVFFTVVSLISVICIIIVQRIDKSQRGNLL